MIIFHRKQFKENLLLLLLLVALLSACTQSTLNNESNEVSDKEQPTQTTIPTVTPLPTATASAIVTVTVISATPTSTPLPSPTSSSLTKTPIPTPITITVPLQIEQEGVSMVWLSGKYFPMGLDAETLLDECRQFSRNCKSSWFESSSPRRGMWVPNDFYIDAYEVTNESFADFLNDIGIHEDTCYDADCFDPRYSQIAISEDGSYQVEENKEKFPITGVTWYGASAFCEWRGVRLPFEAEWEMAAGWDRGSQTKTIYPWGDNFYGDITNFCDESCDEQHALKAVSDGYEETSPVGTYETGRSPSGAYDMGGNVWEWTADWFSPDYVRFGGPNEGDERVVRGGSWFDMGNFTGTSIRFSAPPEDAGDTTGFRCASDVDRQLKHP